MSISGPGADSGALPTWDIQAVEQRAGDWIQSTKLVKRKAAALPAEPLGRGDFEGRRAKSLLYRAGLVRLHDPLTTTLSVTLM